MKPEQMTEETWNLIQAQADAFARWDFEIETAEFTGLNPTGSLAWFKAIGRRKVSTKQGEGLFADEAEIELIPDWFYVHLPARYALEDSSTDLPPSGKNSPTTTRNPKAEATALESGGH